jgi:hypothetical protein
MTSLITLNITDHPEFLKSDEEVNEEESKLREGSNEAEKIEFMKRYHTIDDLLSKLNSIKKLYCDEDLENYILEHREAKGFLPKLVDLNNVPIKI